MGTPFHAKQVDPDKLVWAITALAKGLGMRIVARVFDVDPTTVLGWLVEAAEPKGQGPSRGGDHNPDCAMRPNR